MNLINGTHNFCERKEYKYNVLPEYSIITRNGKPLITPPKKILLYIYIYI